MLNTTTNFRTIRFGSGSTILKARDTAITLDQVAANAPAVMAEGAHSSRSDRYEFLNTRSVLQGLIDNGFGLFEVRQGGSRIEGKREFTKHMLRLRYMGEGGNAALIGRTGSVIPEVIITNAHDGTASWQIGAGMFRIICTNGLVAGKMFDYARIGHTKNAPEKVIDASYRVIEQFPMMIDNAREMSGLQLSGPEQLAFARAAQSLRWDDDAAPVAPPALLEPRRHQDRLADLWTTMNVVQENVVRGGLRYVNENAETGRRMRRTTGEVRGIDENKRLNRAIWTLAEEMRSLKQAA
ncbi:MAG: DUF932 domain-containing protein [Alphaproteobacteria bacterium]